MKSTTYCSLTVFAAVAVAVAAAVTVIAAEAKADAAVIVNPSSSASFYRTWKSMPEYCMNEATLRDMEIPSLSFDLQTKYHNMIKLIQVQVIARHGARAPYYRAFCWDKVASPVDTEWNCGTSSVVSQDIAKKMDGSRGYGRLYNKKFDAGTNILTGTCPVGGLLPLGRAQHRKNGRMLAKTYIGEGPLKLFRNSNLSTINPSEIFLRSDDQERTIGSGQALVDGMFPPYLGESAVVDNMNIWHTMDFEKDYVYPNNKICPILDTLSNKATSSAEFQEFVNSDETKELEKKISSIVGKFSWNTILECLMIARCNDIPLPPAFTEDLFHQAIRHVETTEYLRLTYDDANYAKYGVATILSEAIKRMNLRIAQPNGGVKFAVTIAHDSTLMPIMAAMQGKSWDGRWAPYAGLIAYELYEMSHTDYPSGYAVRVIYKGRASLLPGCKTELCDYSQFLTLMDFAVHPASCAQAIPSLSLVQEHPSTANKGTSAITWLTVGVLMVCCLVLAKLQLRKNSQISTSIEKTPLV